MTRNHRTWADDRLDDPLAWIARALYRFAQDPGCQACIRLAREGLVHVLASLGASGQGNAAAQLCAEILATAADLEEGRRDWSAESVMVLARSVEEIQTRLEQPVGNPIQVASGGETAALRSALPVIPLPATTPCGPGEAFDDSGFIPSALRPLPVAVIDLPEPALPSLQEQPRQEESVQQHLRAEAPGGLPPTLVPAASGRAVPQPRDRRMMVFDPVLLDAVIEDPDRPPSGRLLERLSRTIDGIGIARERWSSTLEGKPVPAGLRARLDVLSRDAAEIGAPRLAEFARALAEFLHERDDHVDGLAAEDVQVLEDGLDVLPLLLAEVHSGTSPATPVLDILLRAQSAGSGADAAEDPPSAEPLPDAAELERIRRQGQQELARLAAAFAVIEDGSQRASAAETSAGSVASIADAPRAADVARIAADQQRIMAALGLAGAELQAIERLGSALAAGSDGSVVGAASVGVAEELERARRVIGSALGEISDVVLDQRRWLAELQDPVDPQDASG